MKEQGHTPRPWRLAVIALVLTASGAHLLNLEVLGPLERGTYDLAIRHLLPSPASSDQVVLIKIDDRSLKELGERWPLSRHTWARFLRQIAKLKPAIVAIDAVFDQPSSARDLDLAESLLVELTTHTGDKKNMETGQSSLLRRLEDELVTRDEDRALEEALAETGDVVLGAFVHQQWPAGLERFPARSPLQMKLINPSALRMQGNVVVGNLSRFAISTRASGGLNIVMDRDGLIRRYPYALGVKNQALASLATAALQESGLHPALSPGRAASYDRGAPLLRSPRPEDVTQASFVDILDMKDEHQTLREAIEGRLVFVGVTATGLHEQFSTPTDVSMPGVELHAAAAIALIKNTLIRSEGLPAWLGLAWSVLLLSIQLFLLGRLRSFGRVLGVTTALLILHALVWWGLLAGAGLLMPALPLPLGLITLAALETWSRHAELQRQKSTMEAERHVTEAKAAFLSTVSHELRTPMTSISGALKLLAAGAVGGLPDKAETMIEIALRNTERLGRLINDVLDIQKIDAGHLQLESKELELGEVIDDAVASITTYADGFNVPLRVNHPDPLPIWGDPDRLVQVITNLISNAVKFSPKGDSVLISAHLKGEVVRLEVQDHGPGIPVSFRPNVFKRFAQASAASNHPSGTGLGLSIVQMLVKRHHGQVGFETKLDVGTTFYLELPLHPPES